MKIKLTALFCFLGSFAFAQSPGDLPPNAQPGKCYAKCLTEESYEEYEIEVPVYTGDPKSKKPKRKKKTIILQDGSSKWIKKKVDPNCDSQDHDDCLVWFLEEIPAVKVKRVIVKDTSKTSEYVMEVFTIKETNLGDTNWREVLCANEVNDYVIAQIRSALVERDFLLFKFGADNILDREAKEALKEFQRENNLPIGNLDFETLDFLGIEY